jgi:ferritin
MLSQNIQDALNDQIQAELSSSYIYLAMAADFEDKNWPGFAAWMRVQSQEETGHAMRLFEYLIKRDGRVRLKAVEAPPAEYESPLAAFQKAYEHEQYITGRINSLFALARESKDPATEALMQWFVNEQVEEEATALQVVEMLKRIGASGSGLVMLDRQLGKRGAP